VMRGGTGWLLPSASAITLTLGGVRALHTRPGPFLFECTTGAGPRRSSGVENVGGLESRWVGAG
jgi:hypothetical protein